MDTLKKYSWGLWVICSITQMIQYFNVEQSMGYWNLVGALIFALASYRQYTFSKKWYNKTISTTQYHPQYLKWLWMISLQNIKKK